MNLTLYEKQTQKIKDNFQKRKYQNYFPNGNFDWSEHFFLRPKTTDFFSLFRNILFLKPVLKSILFEFKKNIYKTKSISFSVFFQWILLRPFHP